MTILQGDTRRAATHIAYLRGDTLGRVARGRPHGLFALEISECLFDKGHQLVNGKAKRREILAPPKQDSSLLASLEAEKGESVEAGYEGCK